MLRFQLCKEVLARLLQRLELRMNIKINKKMIMKIILNNLRARQNENRYQHRPLYCKRVLITVLIKMVLSLAG